MRVKIEMNTRNILFIVIIVICVFALSYGIYYQIFGKKQKEISQVPNVPQIIEDVPFDDLFDNKINLQEYTSANFVNKVKPTQDIVYTNYTLNEIFEGKYEIQVNIPIININHEKIIDIDTEILSVFYNKVNNIIENSKVEGTPKAIYTVSYTAYLNENILSLVIKATLKEGDNAQRVIVKAYTYNISTNQEVSLNEMLEIKKINKEDVKSKIDAKVQEAINYSENLSSLGYEVYKRNMKDDMYKIENSNNYFLGPNGSIYIIYAYGNNNFTTECDVVYVK